jgi:hypothetical protein
MRFPPPGSHWIMCLVGEGSMHAGDEEVGRCFFQVYVIGVGLRRQRRSRKFPVEFPATVCACSRGVSIGVLRVLHYPLAQLNNRSQYRELTRTEVSCTCPIEWVGLIMSIDRPCEHLPDLNQT